MHFLCRTEYFKNEREEIVHRIPKLQASVSGISKPDQPYSDPLYCKPYFAHSFSEFVSLILAKIFLKLYIVQLSEVPNKTFTAISSRMTSIYALPVCLCPIR